MRKHFPSLNHEKTQKIEFFETQLDFLTEDIDHPLVEIHFQFWSVDFRKRLFRSAASQRSANAGQQFSDSERLHNHIVRT